jgi:hypothetical protein
VALPDPALVDTDPAECRRRNRARDRPVPAPVLEGQLRRMRAATAEIRGEGWDLVTTAGQAQPEASHTPGARMAASQQRQRPVRMGLVLQLSRFPWGEDPGGPARWLAAVARAAAEAGLQGIALMDHLIQIPQVGRAWEPIPEPWVTLGMLAGLEPGLRLARWPGPDSTSSSRPSRRFAPCGDPAPGRTTASGSGCRKTTCYPRPVSPIPVIVGGSGEKRTLAIAARLGDGCNLPSDISTLDRKLAIFRQHCRQAGRDPAQAEVTVLDTPVIGRDRDDAASIVEQLRGRTAAAAFAQRHHAGTADEHIGRYRLLADRGVKTVFVSLPHLTDPEDVLRLTPLATAFAGPVFLARRPGARALNDVPTRARAAYLILFAGCRRHGSD